MNTVAAASPKDRAITSTLLLFSMIGLGVWAFLYASPSQHHLAPSDLKFFSLVNVIAIAWYWAGVRDKPSGAKILLLVLPWALATSVAAHLSTVAKNLSANYSLASYSWECIALFLLLFAWIAGFPFPDSGRGEYNDAYEARLASRIRLLSSLATSFLLLVAIYTIRKRAESSDIGEMIRILRKCQFLLFLFLVARILLPLPFLICSRGGHKATS